MLQRNHTSWRLVLLCCCALAASIPRPVNQHVGLGRWCRCHTTFLWALVLCSTLTSVPLAFVSFRTYNIDIPTRTQRKMIPGQKRFDELTNHHFTFCSSNLRRQQHIGAVFVCTHLCAGTDPGGHRERLVYRGCRIFIV